MLNILKSDFYKLKKSKAFWICTALCVLFAIFMVSAMQMGMSRAIGDPNNPEYASMLEMSTQASGIWALQYFLPMGFNIVFIGVFVAIFVSSEFGFGTMKNTLSRGSKRIKVFFSKFIVCSCAALGMLFAFMLALVASGAIVWGSFGIATFLGMLSMIWLQALLIIAFTALFTFISMSMRSSGGAIATNIICVTMASTLLSAISMLFGGSINLSDYWLSSSVSKLATLAPASGDVVTGILVAAGWGIASLLVGTTLFKKLDVK